MSFPPARDRIVSVERNHSLGPTLDAVFDAMEYWGTERRLWRTHGMSRKVLEKILEILDAVKAKWVLVGGTAVGYFTEPRVTLDTDLIVESTKLRTVIARVRKAFPEATIDVHEAVFRIKPYEVDLIRSAGHPLYGEAIRSRRLREEMYLPSVEVYLALKFLSAKSILRARLRRMQDITDFGNVYAKHRSSLNSKRLLELCAMAYPEARRDAVALVDAIDHDKPIML